MSAGLQEHTLKVTYVEPEYLVLLSEEHPKVKQITKLLCPYIVNKDLVTCFTLLPANEVSSEDKLSAFNIFHCYEELINLALCRLTLLEDRIWLLVILLLVKELFRILLVCLQMDPQNFSTKTG